MKTLVRGQDGSSVAEVALIMPLFLLILFGIVEAAEALNVWLILTNETREAARYAVAGARDGDTNLATEVTSFVTSNVGSVLNTSGLTVTVTVQNDGTEPTSVLVKAHYIVPMLTPFTKAVLGNVPIDVESVMRAE
jgi:Flp pilus assembly protein TadG